MDSFSATQSAPQDISLRPESTAVLVVDMVHDFCDPAGAMCLPGAEKLYPIQNGLVRSARDSGMMIGWIMDQHRAGARREREFLKRAPHCLDNTDTSAIMPQLDKQDEDFVFVKRRYSAFFGTDLDLTLRDNLIDTLIVFGVVTNICVRSTVNDAFFLGYDVAVPEDCVAATSDQLQESHLYDIDTHYGTVLKLAELLPMMTAATAVAD